jgi:hypothetical protein
MVRVVDGKRYDCSKSTLLAGDDYWDGHNFERQGRNTFLFRTPKGRYFVQHLSRWQGELDTIEPLSEEEAKRLFESLPEQRMDYDEAFPSSPAEDA